MIIYLYRCNIICHVELSYLNNDCQGDMLYGFLKNFKKQQKIITK